MLINISAIQLYKFNSNESFELKKDFFAKNVNKCIRYTDIHSNIFNSYK